LTHAAALLELIVQHAADGIDRLTDDLADELDTIEDQLSMNASPRERQRRRRPPSRSPRRPIGTCISYRS